MYFDSKYNLVNKYNSSINKKCTLFALLQYDVNLLKAFPKRLIQTISSTQFPNIGGNIINSSYEQEKGAFLDYWRGPHDIDPVYNSCGANQANIKILTGNY